jgi:hypothetical protein
LGSPYKWINRFILKTKVLRDLGCHYKMGTGMNVSSTQKILILIVLPYPVEYING